MDDFFKQIREIEKRMEADMSEMDRMMDGSMDSFFAQDRDVLDEFFLMDKLGFFPSAHPRAGNSHKAPHPRQRLVQGRTLTEHEEQQHSTAKAQSLFREAVRKGDLRKVATLLSRQVVDRSTIDSPYTLGGQETTPLIDACRGGHLEVARLLLEHGGPGIVNARVGRQTPLYVAAQHGHTKLVELLLEYGAEMEPRMGTRRNSTSSQQPSALYSDSPLHAAIRQHHHDVIDVLLGRGASFLSPDYAGDTALDLLRRWMEDM